MGSVIDKENKVLSKLLSMHRDACKFYESTLEKVDNPRYHRSMTELERLHDNVAKTLALRMAQNGTDPAAAHNHSSGLFSDIKGALNKNLLDKLEHAENYCLRTMLQALYDSSLRPDTKAILRRELGNLQKSQDYMRTMR